MTVILYWNQQSTISEKKNKHHPTRRSIEDYTQICSWCFFIQFKSSRSITEGNWSLYLLWRWCELIRNWSQISPRVNVSLLKHPSERLDWIAVEAEQLSKVVLVLSPVFFCRRNLNFEIWKENRNKRQQICVNIHRLL